MKRLSTGMSKELLEELKKNAPKATYKCDICKDKGMYESSSDNYDYVDSHIVTLENVYYKRCKCDIEKEFAYKMSKEAGMKSILDKITNEKYETKYDWQKDYHNRMKNFVKSDSKGFIISGQTGSGKTLLLGKALANSISIGKTGYYFDWHNDYGTKLVDGYKKVNTELLNHLINIDVLYLDDLLKTSDNDLGTAKKKEQEIMLARTIIDKRCTDKNKKTLVSMEWFMNDIEQMDKSLWGRMLEMCGDSDNWINMNPKEDRNIRKQKFLNKF